MKFSVDRDTLLNSVEVASRAVTGRTAQQILECILIKADGECLRVYGNDLELGIESADIEAAVEEAGAIAVDAKILLDIIRKMPTQQS